MLLKTSDPDDSNMRQACELFNNLVKAFTDAGAGNIAQYLADVSCHSENTFRWINTFLETSIALTNHPVCIAGRFTLDLWGTLLKQPLFVDSTSISMPVFNEVLRQLMKKLTYAASPIEANVKQCERMYRVALANNNTVLADFYLNSYRASLMSILQFDNEVEEFDELQTLTTVQNIVRDISAKFPSIALTCCYEYFTSMVANGLANAILSPEDVKIPALCAPLAYYDSLITVTNSCFLGIPRECWTSEEGSFKDVVVNCTALLNSILTNLSRDESILRSQIKLVGVLHPFMGVLQGENVQALFSLLFDYLVYKSESADSGKIRSTAAESLVKIAKEVIPKLATNNQWVSWLVSKISHVFTEGVSPGDAGKLFEFLTLMANGMTDPSARRSFLQNIVEDNVKKCTSSEFMNVVSSPENLVNYLMAAPSNVSSIVAPLQGIYDVGKCVEIDLASGMSPFCDVWVSVIPPVSVLVKSIHYLLRSECRETVIRMHRTDGMYSISLPELLRIANLKTVAPPVEDQTQTKLANIFIAPLSIAYQILGLAASHNFSVCTSESIPGLLRSPPAIGGLFACVDFLEYMRAVSENLSSLELRHMEVFIGKVLTPFCLAFPRNFYDRMGYVIEPILNIIFKEVQRIWGVTTLDKLLPFRFSADLPPELLEAFCIKSRLTFTHTAVEFLQTLRGARFPGKQLQIFSYPAHLELLWEHIFQSNAKTASLTRDFVLFCIKSCPDSTALRKAISICSACLPSIFAVEKGGSKGVVNDLKIWLGNIYESICTLVFESPPHVSTGDICMDIILLTKDIFIMQELGQNPVLALTPEGNIKPSKIKRIDDRIMKVMISRGASSEEVKTLSSNLHSSLKDKKRKIIMREFFQGLVEKFDAKRGVTGTALRRVKLEVEGIAEKVKIINKVKKNDAVKDADLNDFFDDL
jgi:hypothetical protein